MWRVLRPDASRVLSEAGVKRALGRYFAVMRDELPARFRIAKRVPISIEEEPDEEDFWRAHERGLKKYRKLLSEVDDGKAQFEDLETPKYSLLDLKADIARQILESCHFCERRCSVNRIEGETGVCGVGERSRVSSEFMHHGEEPELVPSYTIFFSGCPFKCQFCQNWDISQNPQNGVEVSPQTLASSASTGRREGARNVNWVGGDPIPNLHNILAALNNCKVNIPSVWNSDMYLTIEGMKLLFGTQDIYLTDLKYGNNDCALKYSKIPNYWEIVPRNHRLAAADAELIIRHLVLPGHVECCTRPILEWIVDNLGSMTRVNLMNQYRVCYRANEYEEINRPITAEEFKKAKEIAQEVGLENVIT